MSKYFTKWLPTEEPVVDGGKYWNRQHNCPDDVSGGIHIMILNRGGFRAAKLFLCTKDIQVEDVYEFNIGYAMGSKIAKQSDIDQMHLEIEPFKIIGEVSKEALWVTEGIELLSEVPKEQRVDLLVQSGLRPLGTASMWIKKVSIDDDIHPIWYASLYFRIDIKDKK